MKTRVTINLSPTDFTLLLNNDPSICYAIDLTLMENCRGDYDALDKNRREVFWFILPMLIDYCTAHYNDLPHLKTIISFITGTSFDADTGRSYKRYENPNDTVYGLKPEHFSDLTKGFIRWLRPIQIIQMPSFMLRCFMRALALNSPLQEEIAEEHMLDPENIREMEIDRELFEIGIIEFFNTLKTNGTLEEICRYRRSDAFLSASSVFIHTLNKYSQSLKDNSAKTEEES